MRRPKNQRNGSLFFLPRYIPLTAVVVYRVDFGHFRESLHAKGPRALG